MIRHKNVTQMKFITHFPAFNALAPARVVALNQNVEGRGEREGSISELLANPLSFSFSSVGALESLIQAEDGKLTGKEQHQFAKLVNYHLARLQSEGESSLRSRTLFAIFRRPGLSQFLSPQQRQQIEIFLSRERRELEKLASTKVEDWKPAEAIRVARSYRFVRNRLNTANLGIDEKTRNTGDNLKLYGAQLADKATLTNLDKLFLVELKRVFRDSGDWKNLDVHAKVIRKANVVEDEFRQALSDPAKNIPSDAQYYWDVLVPESDEELATDSVLRNFLSRSADVESLQAILEKDKGGADIANTNVPLLLSIEEYSFLKTLAGSPVVTIDTDGEAKNAVDKAKADKQALSDAHTELEQQRAAEETTLKRSAPVELKEHPDLPAEQKNTFDEAWLNVDPAQTDPAEGAEPTEVHTNFAAYKAWRDVAVKEILNASTTLSEEAITAKKAEAEALSPAVEEAEKAHEKLKNSLEIYANPSAKAAEALDSHKKYFKARLSAGRLLTTDFDLIAHLDDATELLGTEGEHVKTLIDDTRDMVRQVLRGELSIPSLDELGEQDLAKADKFLSYEALIKRVAATKANGETNTLLEALDARDSNIDARQLLGAVVLNVREDILKGITSQETRNSESYNTFLDHYSRQHHSINKTDRVEKMLSFTNNMEAQKKDKVNDVYEHAYEKVSSLFAKAEKGAILEGLNKILKTEISATTVLNNIQARLPDNGFIHSASKGEISNFKSAIVSELQGRVTAENNDPTHLNSIAEDLLAKLDQHQASEVAKEALKAGVKQMEETNEDNLAVSDRLELAKRTRLIYFEVADVNENFGSQLSSIVVALEKGEGAEDLITHFLQGFDQSWLPRLKVLKDALVAECKFLLGEDSLFAKELDLKIESTLKNLKLGVDQLRETFNKDETIDPTDEGFKLLIAAINNEVLPLFNLESGTLAKKEEVKLDSTLKNAAKTHAFVRDDLGVLKPGGAEKARGEYEKKLKGYEQTVENFKTSWESSKKRLAKDLKKYNEEEFSGKHQISKKQARKIINDNNNRVDDAEWMLEYFAGGHNDLNPFAGSKDGVFDRWLAAYEDPSKQPRALNFMNGFKEFKAILGSDQENFAKEAEEMDAFTKDFDNNKPTLWFKKKYKLTWNTYTLKSIYMMGKQFWEYWGKFTERKNDKKAAELGSKIFGNSKFGREYARDSNKKQDERVGDFKDVHKSSDYQQLFNIISKAKNADRDKDEVQAALELLMEKGLMRWDSADFLQMLSRLQDGVTFSLPNDIELYAENPAALKEKIGQAVTAIWDRPTWEQWQSDLPSKYESKMKSFEREYKEQVQKGGVERYIITTLEKWATGETDPNFERAKYEQFLFSAFENGEVNGKKDKRWFYLIKGLTLKNPRTGETILSPEALAHLGALQSNFPFVDALDDKQGWKKNGKVVPEGTEDAHQGIWDYNDIQAWGRYFSDINSFDGTSNTLIGERSTKWFQETLIPTFDAKNRMDKIDHQKVDHDDMWSIPLLVDTEAVNRLFNTVSDGGAKLTIEQSIGFVGNFEPNMRIQTEAFLKMRAEHGSASGYNVERDKSLRRIGMMVKSYLVAINKLAGNYHTDAQTEPAALGREAWADDSKNGLISVKKKIEESAKSLTGESFESFNLRMEGKSYSRPKSEDARPEREKKLIKAVTSEKFSDVDSVERFLENYAQANGISA